MQKEIQDVLLKGEYNIKDLAKIVKKQTNTIRSWESKGIINKPEDKFSNGWRRYSKLDLVDALSNILAYDWQRKTIKNEEEVKHIISYLNGDIEFKDQMSLMESSSE